MALHKWRQRLTKYFGQVWLPLAFVKLRAQSGRHIELALQVDSGAVVSLLRRSLAEVLGLPLASGRRIELSNVSGGKTVAFVHVVYAVFGESIEKSIPFEFAENDDVPNLLGFVGVFDSLQIGFDPIHHELSIAPT